MAKQKPRTKQEKENTQGSTKRGDSVVERAVTENDGLLGRSARTLRDRKKSLDQQLRDAGA